MCVCVCVYYVYLDFWRWKLGFYKGRDEWWSKKVCKLKCVGIWVGGRPCDTWKPKLLTQTLAPMAFLRTTHTPRKSLCITRSIVRYDTWSTRLLGPCGKELYWLSWTGSLREGNAINECLEFKMQCGHCRHEAVLSKCFDGTWGKISSLATHICLDESFSQMWVRKMSFIS